MNKERIYFIWCTLLTIGLIVVIAHHWITTYDQSERIQQVYSDMQAAMKVGKK